MRIVRMVLLAGIAATALAGSAGAENKAVHTLSIQLPGGGIETIRYTGNVAPQVILAPPQMVAFAPAFPGFGADPVFVRLERISAEMHRQMAGMMQRAEMMNAQLPGELNEAMLKNAPGSSYSFVSTLSGSGVCMRSIQITSTPRNKPQVVSHTSGDCKGAPDAAAPAVLPVAPPVSGNHLQTISTKLGDKLLAPGVWHRI